MLLLFFFSFLLSLLLFFFLSFLFLLLFFLLFSFLLLLLLFSLLLLLSLWSFLLLFLLFSQLVSLLLFFLLSLLFFLVLFFLWLWKIRLPILSAGLLIGRICWAKQSAWQRWFLNYSLLTPYVFITQMTCIVSQLKSVRLEQAERSNCYQDFHKA